MKPVKRITSALTTAALLTGLAVNFNACTEQTPFAPAENDADASITTLAKKGGKGSGNTDNGGSKGSGNTDNGGGNGGQENKDPGSDVSYPQSASITLSWSQGTWGATRVATCV